MDSNLIQAYRFHYEHDGYIVGQRAVCALRAARAEIAADEMDWTFAWEYDDDPDLSWMNERELQKEHEVLVCFLKNADGEILESLGGIVDADRNYRRVIEAELALEADAYDVLNARADEIASGLTAEVYA